MFGHNNFAMAEVFLATRIITEACQVNNSFKFTMPETLVLSVKYQTD